MTINADDPGDTQQAFAVHMLVAVQKKTRLAACDVAAKSLKALMSFVSARVFMDAPGRVVGYEHIHRREAQESTFDFLCS